MPVIYQDAGNRKVEKIDLRKVGDRDESFRVRETRDEMLLGVVLPVDGDRGEFVYISAGSEQGIVFQDSDVANKLLFSNSDGTPFFLSHNGRSFVDYVNCIVTGYKDRARLILNEDTDPSRYGEIVEAAVHSARRRQIEIKQKRGETRKNMFHTLFGGE